MIHYLAIFENAGPEFAVGVVFPDLPGCFSAGDTMEQAFTNAQEAIDLWMDDPDLQEIPKARTLEELQTDPEFNEGLKDFEGKHVFVLVPYQPKLSKLAAE